MKKEVDRIPSGLWAPLPIPAIKYLARNGHRLVLEFSRAYQEGKAATLRDSS